MPVKDLQVVEEEEQLHQVKQQQDQPGHALDHREDQEVDPVEARTPGKRLAPGADTTAQSLVDVNTLDHPQHELLQI